MPLEKKHKAMLIVGASFLLISAISYAFRKKIAAFVLDQIQEYHISQLHPSVQDRFRNFIGQVEQMGYKVIVTSSYRSFIKQQELNKLDSRNAQPGLSHHNYGFALDFVIDKDGYRWTNQVEWNNSRDKTKVKYLRFDWEKTGIPQLAKSLGFQWGGDIVGYYDPVHFNIPADSKYLKELAFTQFGPDLTKIQGNKVQLV